MGCRERCPRMPTVARPRSGLRIRCSVVVINHEGQEGTSGPRGAAVKVDPDAVVMLHTVRTQTPMGSRRLGCELSRTDTALRHLAASGDLMASGSRLHSSATVVVQFHTKSVRSFWAMPPVPDSAMQRSTSARRCEFASVQVV